MHVAYAPCIRNRPMVIRAFGLLSKIDSLRVSMQFEKTGLRTKVRWKVAKP